MLQVRGLTLGARVGGRAVDVLRDLTLAIEPGQVLGLVGESGAGKSMLGRVVAGQLPAGFAVTHGSVTLDGRDLLALPPARRRRLLGRQIAFVPQEPLTALNPVLTIGQTFGEHLMRLGVPRALRRARIQEQLAAVGLPDPQDMLRRYPHQLSGGQCQRVLIAMAFVANPALIVADEPTTALDVVSQTVVLRLLAEQRRARGTAVLLITHDLRLAAHVCDRIAVLYAGDLVEDGPAHDVLRGSRHHYTGALQHAMPDVHGPPRRLPALPGQMPGISELAALSGCRFASRCEARLGACEQAPPALVECGRSHRVRCLAPRDAQTLLDVVEAEVATAAAALPQARADAASAAPLVELRRVGLRYTARRGLLQRKVCIDAVSDVSLQIRPGEFVGIVGESGSGKSSVARLIVDVERPTSGQLLIGGEDAEVAPARVLALRREHLQMVFQDPHSALNPRRTVLRLLTQAYEASHRRERVDRRTRDARAAELLRDVGLPDDALQRYPSQLSGGQKQRVSIGRALCVMPRLLVADEIVSGLDVSVQAQILNLLQGLGRRHGIALLLISHDLSVVRYLCSRVIVMQRGTIVEQGPTDEIFARPQHPYTQLLLASVPSADPARAWPPDMAPG